ncbi:MAG: hypothetical protein ACUVWX_03200 [Kiritimatiellia bacterium]
MRTHNFVLVGIAGILVMSFSGEVIAEEATVKHIVLVNASAVSEKMAERLRSFAQNELDVSVRLASLSDPKARTLREAGKPLLAARGPADVLVIGLINPTNDVPIHMVVLPDIKVAVINAKGLRHNNEEIYGRRLERQVMRCAAFLLGLSPCPEPRDVTYNYRSLEELDRIGRNFSAPWNLKFKKAAEAVGLFPPAKPHPPRSRSTPASESVSK